MFFKLCTYSTYSEAFVLYSFATVSSLYKNMEYLLWVQQVGGWLLLVSGMAACLCNDFPGIAIPMLRQQSDQYKTTCKHWDNQC